MTRHELRERIFQTIFQIPFYEDELPEIDVTSADDPTEEDIATDKEREYIAKKAADIKAHISEIDAEIEAHSNGWKVKRIGKSELAILRLAVYEIRFDDDIPDKVAVNEAIELAKAYSDEKASKFINGVLSGLLS